jgi:hypothetical protein
VGLLPFTELFQDVNRKDMRICLQWDIQPFTGGFAGASSSELESSELDSSACFFAEQGVDTGLFDFFNVTGVVTGCFGAES